MRWLERSRERRRRKKLVPTLRFSILSAKATNELSSEEKDAISSSVSKLSETGYTWDWPAAVNERLEEVWSEIGFPRPLQCPGDVQRGRLAQKYWMIAMTEDFIKGSNISIGSCRGEFWRPSERFAKTQSRCEATPRNP